MLATLMGLSLFIHLIFAQKAPPCFSVDEAAYGYNAYSILKTGRDEFGKFLPLRLQSFNDQKLPLYSYLSIPFILIGGLNEVAVRIPTYLAAMFLVPVIYLLAKQLLQKDAPALLAAGLVAVSPWVNTISRHAHEVVLATLFVNLALLCLLKYRHKPRVRDALFFLLAIGGALYTYHIGRIYFILLGLVFLVQTFRNRLPWRTKLLLMLAFAVLSAPFLLAEWQSPPSRLANLFILNNDGLNLISNQLKTEFAYSPFSSKIFVLVSEIQKRYFSYFSYEFLVTKGDATPRFGMEGISPITTLEYLFFLVGIGALFIKSRPAFYILIALLIIAPLTAALSWQEYSLTRAYFMIFPLLIFAAYGFYISFHNQTKLQKLFVGALVVFSLMFTLKSWDFFFLHYPKRATVVRSYFCGYLELATYIQSTSKTTKKYHITTEVGQPYIALAFYLKYPPQKLQKEIRTSPPDEYGYSNVLGFNKFVFNTGDFSQAHKGDVFVFSQSEAQNSGINLEKFTKITKNGEDIFLICDYQCFKKTE